ncbi:hypothetical protein [Nocardioides sp. B-3]|uniref:hypothetical protein n=1 Tax=Nocardioides sp. B-3 TaxID=2895565 RepID=UPI00215316FA|nr:hypothetical protein [Nocardioides sp. B-3]UUZ59889.1 hypothetical protein LP418_02245 [Nocardioides sp. B-3]
MEVGTSDDPDAMVIGVNREFLLQALQAGDQLTLGPDGPIAPLAIRNPDRSRHALHPDAGPAGSARLNPPDREPIAHCETH